MEFLGHTLDFVGKLLVSYTVLTVHMRVREEHKIDEKVFGAMKKEKNIGIIGIAMMILGYILEAPFRIWIKDNGESLT